MLQAFIITDRKKMQHLLFAGLFLLTGIILVQRSFYGFNTADEMYFIGTSERIFRGEKVLIDEWNPTQQLCSFLLHPIYSLMRSLLGSTEGIVMASRFLYLAYAGIITVFLYLRLQRRGFAAFGPVFLFWLYAPFGICAMSYNSIEFGILTVLLAVLSADMEHSVPEYILCGILIAIIVLANPFAIALYLAYGLLCLWVTFRNRRLGRETEGVLLFRNFLWMTLGAGILLILFLLFVFQRGTLEEMLANVPHIIGDSEHQGQSGFWYKTWRYFHLCFKNYKYMFCGMGLVYVATLADRKRLEHGRIYMTLASLIMLADLIYFGFVFDHIQVNYQMLPLAFWCLEAYFLTEHKDKRIFYGWYLPSVLFTLIVQYATNTGMVTISAAYSMASCVGLLFAAQWFRENLGGQQERTFRQKAPVILAVAVVVIQFTGTFTLRMNYAWGDELVKQLTRPMERGPLKGVYTTPKTADWYESVLEELDMLELTPEDQLMVVGVAPWIYLYVDAGCGNYSTWQVHENSTQLYDYYALHPDKFPDVVYMPHWADIFLECELSGQFWEKCYEVVHRDVAAVMMSPERAAKWKAGESHE